MIFLKNKISKVRGTEFSVVVLKNLWINYVPMHLADLTMLDVKLSTLLYNTLGFETIFFSNIKSDNRKQIFITAPTIKDDTFKFSFQPNVSYVSQSKVCHHRELAEDKGECPMSLLSEKYLVSFLKELTDTVALYYDRRWQK